MGPQALYLARSAQAKIDLAGPYSTLNHSLIRCRRHHRTTQAAGAGFRLSVAELGGDGWASASQALSAASTSAGGGRQWGPPAPPGPPNQWEVNQPRGICARVFWRWLAGIQHSVFNAASGCMGTQVSLADLIVLAWRSGGSRGQTPLVMAVEVPFSPGPAADAFPGAKRMWSRLRCWSPRPMAFAISEAAAFTVGPRNLLIDRGRQRARLEMRRR